MRVVAVVLAIGSNQLLVHRGETLVHRAARIAREVADEAIVLVPNGFGVADYVEVSDPDDALRLGVARAGEARILVLSCEQPLVTADHLRALLAVDAPIVATGRHRGVAGVPAAFAPRFIPELGERGVRVVIEAHRDETAVVGTDIDSDEGTAWQQQRDA